MKQRDETELNGLNIKEVHTVLAEEKARLKEYKRLLMVTRVDGNTYAYRSHGIQGHVKVKELSGDTVTIVFTRDGEEQEAMMALNNIGELLMAAER